MQTYFVPEFVLSTEAPQLHRDARGETRSFFSPTNAVISTEGAHLRRSGETPVLALRSHHLIFILIAILSALTSQAQTLAHPGWAGSGLTQEIWWQDAVFYRIQPRAFQDSDGDGIGDLRGIASRLDYLQSLGVDAIVLEPPFDEDGFDDLLSDASRRHIRLIIALSTEAPADETTTIAKARQWLTRGAAGIDLLPSLDAAGKDVAQDPAWLEALRTLTESFPGQRVLLAESLPSLSNRLRLFDPRGAQLADAEVDNSPGPAHSGMVTNFRNALAALEARGSNVPLLVSDDGFRSATAYGSSALGTNDEARARGIQLTLAAMLLASRGAVSLLYGQELAMPGWPDAAMRWTPSNLTPATVPATTEAKPEPVPTAPKEDVYGAFVPYVPPVKKPVAANGEPAFDPDALPGFSAKAADASTAAEPVKATWPTHNAAVEDHDSESLLNFYRRLSQLHHGNATLRTGSTIVLDHDAESALVWVRRAPAGARTVATIVVACNLSSKPVTLSLTRDLEHARIRSGTLRNLLTSDRANAELQSTDRLTLAPWSLYLGEIYHH